MNALKAANSLVMRLLFIVATLLLSSCCSFSAIGSLDTEMAKLKIQLPEIEKPVARHVIHAGAAKVDITPPPGFPMGGHSIIGQISRGHWLRLKARSIYIESGDGSKLALVASDLWSMPAGLADRVAEIVGSSAPKQCRLGRDQMVFAATHTHQSPGNFSTSPLYNKGASLEPGFDQDLFEFLAERLAVVVQQSCVEAEEAVLSFANRDVELLARNRSINAFLKNPEAGQIIKEGSKLKTGVIPEGYTQNKHTYHAIDPRLQTIWIRSAVDPARIIGVAAFTAVHTTALNHKAEIYSGDLFGVAAMRAEQRLSKGKRTPVVAIFNGPEGDVSPAWAEQVRKDVMELGARLGDAILNSGTIRQHQISENIMASYAIKPLADQCTSAQADSICTTKESVGTPALLAGAEDGRTCLFDCPINCLEGDSGWICRNIFFPLARDALKDYPAPKEMPLGVYKIGDIVIATLPGEFTTVMGRRIRMSLAKKLLSEEMHDRVILIGLANEYLSYFTTPEEYKAGHYEAGMTLYGEAAGTVVGEHLTTVANALRPGHSKQHLKVNTYVAGRTDTFSPKVLKTACRDRLEKKIIHTMYSEHEATPELYSACWSGMAPSVAEVRQKSWQPTPSVEVEEKLADGSWQPLIVNGVVENDEGLNLIVQLSAWRGSDSQWCAFWLPPAGLEHRDALRFRVTGHEGSVFYYHWISVI